MTPLTAPTCERAWLIAAEHLAEAPAHTDYNLVVEIANPVEHSLADLSIRDEVDRFLRGHNANPVTTVAGTIFPAADYVEHGSRGVYEVYPEETYPEILGTNDWGRYAERMLRWPARDPSASPLRPLESLVEKMKVQLAGRRMRACYEISLTDSAIDLPLYDPRSDRKRPRGGPCLSHVSFKVGAEDVLYLTALYRSHSYVARALGNFLGLADLQAFVCEETGLAPGPLVCVSTYARLEADGPWSVTDAKALVANARGKSPRPKTKAAQDAGGDD